MCQYCGGIATHAPRCPLYEEPKGWKCKECGEYILEGEKYATIRGHKYHEECLEDMCIERVLRLFGYKLEEM